MKVARLVFALVLVSLMAGSVMAQDNSGAAGGGGRGRGRGGFGMGGGTATMLDRVINAANGLEGLSADEKDKLTAIKTEYAPKFTALREKRENILTADQKAALKEAMDAARKASPDDRRAAFAKVRDAVKLTDDQKTQQTAVGKEVTTLMEEVRPKIDAALSADHQAKLKELMNRRGGRRRGQGGQGGDQTRST